MERAQELVEQLDAAIALLTDDSESFWRKWMEAARAQIVSRDIAGVEKLLDAYGGMGSFTDLVIRQKMGGFNPGVQEANERLSALRGSIYALAKDIMRDFLGSELSP
jgi:hypothetical protein